MVPLSRVPLKGGVEKVTPVRERETNCSSVDHAVRVLDTFDEASDALKAKSYGKVKAALDAGTEVVSKRIKVIKMAGKSDFGRSKVNEYL